MYLFHLAFVRSPFVLVIFVAPLQKVKKKIARMSLAIDSGVAIRNDAVVKKVSIEE